MGAKFAFKNWISQSDWEKPGIKMEVYNSSSELTELSPENPRFTPIIEFLGGLGLYTIKHHEKIIKVIILWDRISELIH